jgi:CRP/FNR family transcriptional regulator
VDPTSVLLLVPMFRDLDRDAVSELLPHLRERRYAAGQCVWVEGDPADSLYVIAEGVLKSHRISAAGADLILALHSAVDATGEVGLFHPSGVRRVSVTAMTAARCLTLHRDPLLAFMTAHPPAMRRMLERLSTLTVKAAYSFSSVAFEDIRRRVAGALLTLVDEFGEPSSDGTRIRLRLSQATLASLVAASRENVNRALAGFITAGVVSHQNGHFRIHDRAALESVVAL